LVLGIPTYGRSYTLYNPLATEIGSPADGPGEQGDATREKGYLAYYEVFPLILSYSLEIIITIPITNIKRRLSSGNACYHSDQSLLSSRLF
jgi:hypothetical protein